MLKLLDVVARDDVPNWDRGLIFYWLLCVEVESMDVEPGHFGVHLH